MELQIKTRLRIHSPFGKHAERAKQVINQRIAFNMLHHTTFQHYFQ